MAKIIKGEKRGRPGRWLLDFYDQDGKRRIETYETQKEAKDARAERLKGVKDRTYVSPAAVPTLEAVAVAWLANKVAANLRPATIAAWEVHVHQHIAPELGTRRVTEITIEDVEALRDRLLAKPLAAQTVNKILTTLTAIVAHAQRSVPALVNVAERAERARPKQEILASENGAEGEQQEISPEEVPSAEWVNAVLAACEPGLFNAYFNTAAMTGAREEELLALPWSAVDLDRHELRVARIYSWARTRAEREAGLEVPRLFPPKTRSSRRVIPMPAVLSRILRRWRDGCPASAEGLVFPRADGFPMHRKALHNALRRAVAKVSEGREEPLAWFTIHSLRHFYASMLAAQGKLAIEVAAYLGHKDARTTQMVYQHWFPKTRTTAADDVADAIFAATGRGGSKTVAA